MTGIGGPSTADLAALAKRLEDAAKAAAKSEADLEDGKLRAARIAARDETEQELIKLYHSTIADVAKGGLDRARDGAKYLQVAATAIAGFYTGVLGLAFAADGSKLPLRGVFAAVFLGLAVALSAGYTSFLLRSESLPGYVPGPSRATNQLKRTSYLSRWVKEAALERRALLQAAVTSLAVGVALIPAPFIAATVQPAAPIAVVAAPAIPEAIPSAIAAEAQEVFATQSQAYTEYIEVTRTAGDDGGGSAIGTSCDVFPLQRPFYKCSWKGDEAALNAAFFWTSVLGLIVVALAPLVSYLWENQEARVR